MKVNVKAFLKKLEEFADPKRAEIELKYHKSSRKHLGVKTSSIDATIRPYIKELEQDQLLELADELWKTDVFEAMIAAARIMSHKKMMPSHRIWLTIKKWMEDVDGWALEDNIARAVWKCVRVNPEILHELDEWTYYENLWYRRAVLVFTLPFAKKGMSPKLMLDWAARYASDPEWFIQKAIGWWLRDLGSHAPDKVVKFLNEHWDELQTVAKKEATRKLDKQLLKNIKGLKK